MSVAPPFMEVLMMAKWSFCILLFVLLQIPTEFEPAHLKKVASVEHNPNVIATTWVIADLDIGLDGHVRFPRVLKGGEPHRSSVLSSVSNWIFAPARATTEVESHVTAVFLFRSR